MRILFLGDIVGRHGRQLLATKLPLLRQRLGIDAIIANGENAAGGIGITRETARDLRNAGVDVITLGNHAWRHAEVYGTLNQDERLLRPANVAPALPGRGSGVYTLEDGRRFAVCNLLGRTFMDPADCPFRAVDAIFTELPDDIRLRFVDFHAEASSEKRAMGFFLAGRVSAVVGTHTHVQTADAMILPGGTAYLTDLGMCGVEKESILGMDPGVIVDRFVTGLPGRFKAASGEATLNGLLLDADDETGQATAIHLLRGNDFDDSNLRTLGL